MKRMTAILSFLALSTCCAIAAGEATDGGSKEAVVTAGPGKTRSVMQASSRAYLHYILGKMYDIRGDIPSALRQYTEAVVYDPANPYLRLVLSNSHAMLLNIKGAITQAQEAVELDPSYTDAYLQLGMLYFITGSKEESEASFRQAIKISPGKMEGYIELIRVLYSEKREKDAEDIINLMTVNLPDDPAAWFETGRIFYEKRLLDKADIFLRKSLEKDPAYISAGYLLSESLSLQDRKKEAAKILESLQKYAGDDPDLMLRLGILALEEGEAAEAKRYFEHIRKYSYDEVETGIKIAAACIEIGETRFALGELDDLLKSFPRDDSLKYWKGLALEELRDYDNAGRIFSSIPSASRYHADALIHGAYCDTRSGRPQAAIKTLKESVYLGTVSPLAAIVLSDAWEKIDGKVEGISFFKELLEKYPGVVEISEGLSGLQEKNGDFDGAKDTLENMLKGPDLPVRDREKTMMLLATLLERNGKSPEALNTARAVLLLNPDNPEAMNFVGYSMAEMDADLPDAEKLVKRALLFKPYSGSIIDSLGWIYFKTGDYQKALSVLLKADRLSPDEPEILEHLGDALQKNGRHREAVEKYRRALKLATDEKLNKRIKAKLDALSGKK